MEKKCDSEFEIKRGDIVSVERVVNQPDGGRRWSTVLDRGVVTKTGDKFVAIWDKDSKYQAGPTYAELFPRESTSMKLIRK